jgi:hypothetical protein
MQNLNDYINFLGLKKPVVLRIKTRKNKHDYDALYESHYSDRTGKLLEHRITIFTQDAHRDFDTLLAHELIHAWQEENSKAEIHGKHFRKYAKRMTEHFGLQNIYIKGVDTN